MKAIVMEQLSLKYRVRRLNEMDIPLIHSLCLKNTQYYEYCGQTASEEEIENDLIITPPGIPMEQKYYIGFFQGEQLVAVMDLIDGYPDDEIVFIGFFMMEKSLQGKGIGSKIIEEALEYLKSLGFHACRLGIDKDNPQSNYFWQKNGFSVIKEVERTGWTILYAERLLQ